MIGRTNTGGGVGLNFKVIGNPKPTTAKENTIWINTDEKIPSCVFSATEPENPVHGMVWIKTGTASGAEFNALKKNALQVYPVFAKLYVNGAWTNEEAHIWKVGWKQFSSRWAGELYDSGDEYEGVTGGFVAVEMAYTPTYAVGSAPVIERNNSYIKATQNTATGGGALVTKNKIDITGYTKLCYTGEFRGFSMAGSSAMGVWSDLGIYQNDYLFAKLPSVYGQIITNGTLDISGLPSGEYYIGFHLFYINSYVKITKMWLE